MFRAAILLSALVPLGAADLALPKPELDGGKPLMQALAGRHTTREFAAKPLSPQVLSNLLWAAYGVNRPATGGRTAPSARNWQTIDVYVALSDALYLYDAKAHALKQVAESDARAATGAQDFVGTAPLNLVYVARLGKAGRAEAKNDVDMISMVSVEAGAVSQNVSLYCASEGLVTVVRATISKSEFTKLARLPHDAVIVLAQTVGYPK